MLTVNECMQACQQVAVDAEFPSLCGKEMLQGCLEDFAQNWSDEQFQKWFEGMEVKYGSRSPLGISMIGLYRSVMRILQIYDTRVSIEMMFAQDQ